MLDRGLYTKHHWLDVNKNLPAFHRYLEIKKRMMGVDTLKYLDLYAPVVKDVDLKYTYDEAAGSITLNGAGAYLGLAKAINGSELASPGDAPDSVTYIAALSDDGTKMLAGDNGGRLWYFNGTSWVEERPKGDVDGAWWSISLKL